MRDKDKTSLIEYLKAPLSAAVKNGLDYFLWIVFLIVAGQLGTIINIINRCVFHGWHLKNSLLADSISGNFYTFSIVLVTSVLGSLVINYMGRKSHEHKRITITAIVLAFLFCLINAVFFSSATQDYAAEYENVAAASIGVDWWQLIFYVLSFFVATYLFGLERIANYREYDRLEQYGRGEKANIAKLQKGKNINNGQAGDIAL